MNKIEEMVERCLRDSFWSGTDLFGYVQLFVVSNGAHAKYDHR